ncbi:DUF5671 domain-containing protein [soil metagenome]
MVALAIRISGRGGAADGGEGAGLRRFFQYLLLYGLLIVSAVGLSGLLARASGTDLVRPDGAGVARALTFTVIGIPLYIGVAWWSRRRLLEDPEEARSFGWAFYVTGAALTALVPAMVSAWAIVSWALGQQRWDGTELASLLVWGGVWAAHWVADRRVTPSRPSHFHTHSHVLAGSGIGLSVAAVGFARLLMAALDLVLPGRGPDLVSAGTDPLLRGAAVFLVGAPVWAWYWLRAGLRLERHGLWQVYVLLAGVASGLVAAISAASVIVYDVLVRLIGRPTANNAAQHFDALAPSVAIAATGVLLWWYHRSLLGATGPDRSEVRRVYEYLMSAGGLLAAASGFTTVLVALIEAVVGPSLAGVGGAPVNTLLAAVTLLSVGGPVWWIFWRRIQRAVTADPSGEVTSPTRRTYLFVLFGVVGLAAIIALLVAVFMVFEAIFEASLGAETVRSMRAALGILVTGGAMAAYHWAVYRSDRAIVPSQVRRGPSNVVLVGPADEGVVEAVAAATGARVQLWRRADETSERWPVASVIEAVTTTDWNDVVVMLSADGPLVIIPVDRS